jgi:putative ABC transport system permease protein
MRFWRTASRIAWKDLRSSPIQSAWIVCVMAVSLAAIGGVHSAANVARAAIHTDSRAWLAGDIGIDLVYSIEREQIAALDRLQSQGIAWTVVTSAWTMASSDESPDPGVISVKAVDPALYPFYGELTLDPPLSLGAALKDETVVVSEEVLERLQVRIGDTIRIGGQPFRIAARIATEPDRFSGAVGLGMRCILSRGAYARSGVEASGNSVRNRVLLRLPAGADISAQQKMLEKLFPGGSAREYRGAFRQQTETVISFLSMTAFLALAFGTIGLAVAARQHAEDRMPSVAIMKMVGGRGSQIALILLVEIGAMAAAAVVVAAPLGSLIRASVLSLAGRYLILPPTTAWDLLAVVGGAFCALAAMAPLLVEPALSIRDLRPAEVIRRGTGEIKSAPRKARLFRLAAAVCLASLFLAVLMLRAWISALIMLVALSAAMGLALLLTIAAAALLRRWTRRLRFRFPLLAHGIASLHRPGNHSRLLVVALATSLTMLNATYAAGSAVSRAVLDVLPYDRNSLYLTRFRDSNQGGVRAFLAGQPGVMHVEVMTQVRLQLRSMTTPGSKRIAMFDAPYLSVCDSSLPPAGLLIANDVARKIGAKSGSTLAFEVRDRTIHRSVTTIRPFGAADRVWSTIHLNCAGLDETLLFHQAAVEVDPSRLSDVRRALRIEFPSLAVVTADDISETMKVVSRDAMTLARVVTWYALAAGLCMMIAIVAASRLARSREIAILSAIGSPRSAMLLIYTVEFASTGLLAGLIAGLLSAGFTSATFFVIFQRLEMPFRWMPLIAAVGISSLATIIAGWLPSIMLLFRRPMDIIRG